MPLHELLSYLSWWAMPIAYMFSAGCCCGPLLADVACSDCNTDTTPATFQVVFYDVENDHCTECTNFNTTTFILTQEDGTPCRWKKDRPLPCDDDPVFSTEVCKIEFQADVLSAWRLLVRNDLFGCLGGEASGSVGGGFPADCLAVDFTGVAISDGSNVANCKWSSASTPATFDVVVV